MNLNRIWILALVVALTQFGCSSSSDKGINYRSSAITPTLEVPPDLVTPAADRNLELPGSRVGKPDNKGRYVETGNLNVADTHPLPKMQGLSLHSDGEVYWLTVDRPVEEVYPLVKKFWAEQGFRLVKDEPLIGIMQTEWLSIKSGNDSFFASLLASMRSAESRDQYMARLERENDHATRIYITQRGQELIIDENVDALDSLGLKEGWQFVPSDNSKEVEMLSRLMIFLGMQQAQVQQQLASLGSLQPRSKLALNKDNQPYVLVNSGIQQTLNRLRYKMDKLGVAVSAVNKSGRQITLQLDSQALTDLGVLKIRQLATVGIRLQDSVNSNTTRIDVLDNSGNSVHDEQAVSLMNFLVKQLK